MDKSVAMPYKSPRLCPMSWFKSSTQFWAAHFDDLYAYKLYRQNNITEEEKDELKETPAKIKKLTKQFISELLD